MAVVASAIAALVAAADDFVSAGPITLRRFDATRDHTTITFVELVSMLLYCLVPTYPPLPVLLLPLHSPTRGQYFSSPLLSRRTPTTVPRAVDALRGPLEADIREAAAACWTLSQREITVRGTLKLRSHQLTLHEARFDVDAETQLLGASLQQWKDATLNNVAAAALATRIAERRLIHAVYRCVAELADH